MSPKYSEQAGLVALIDSMACLMSRPFSMYVPSWSIASNSAVTMLAEFVEFKAPWQNEGNVGNASSTALDTTCQDQPSFNSCDNSGGTAVVSPDGFFAPCSIALHHITIWLFPSVKNLSWSVIQPSMPEACSIMALLASIWAALVAAFELISMQTEFAGKSSGFKPVFKIAAPFRQASKLLTIWPPRFNGWQSKVLGFSMIP